MSVKPHHPLAELLHKALFGISIVPKDEQEKIVKRAISKAVKWYKNDYNGKARKAEE